MGLVSKSIATSRSLGHMKQAKLEEVGPKIVDRVAKSTCLPVRQAHQKRGWRSRWVGKRSLIESWRIPQGVKS